MLDLLKKEALKSLNKLNKKEVTVELSKEDWENIARTLKIILITSEDSIECKDDKRLLKFHKKALDKIEKNLRNHDLYPSREITLTQRDLLIIVASSLIIIEQFCNYPLGYAFLKMEGFGEYKFLSTKGFEKIIDILDPESIEDQFSMCIGDLF